ncbi:MAG: hypothetical protein CL840_21705 [Crocinitomicaceae bacterium]|nr:hypothetical protein [Crocinitomicaceae bacterium]|tara:strand:- start:11954 stop:14023 length:2070 start_codon:yes stop_codon:yes gene_type:complete
MKRLFELNYLFIFLLIGLSTHICFSQKINLDSLEKAVELEQNDKLKVDLLNHIGFQYYRSNPSKCLEYSTAALSLAKSIKYKTGIAQSNKNLGVYYSIIDDYSKSLDAYDISLKLFTEINDQVGVGEVLGNIGIVYQYQQEYNSALDYFLQSLEIQESRGSQKDQAVVLGNLGNLYDQQSEYGKAMEYYSRALKVFENLNDRSQIANVYGNLGLVYLNQSNYSEAEEYFLKAIGIDSALNNQFAQSNNLGNLGLVYNNLGEYGKAFESYKKALEIDEKLGNINGVAFDLRGFGQLFLDLSRDSVRQSNNADMIPNKDVKKHHLKLALENAKKAKATYAAIDEPNYKLYLLLKEIYWEYGDYKKSLEYLDLYWTTRNEIFSSRKSKDFARLEERHQRTISKNKILLLESESSKNYVILVSVCIILLLSLIAGTHFFYQLKQKKIVNQDLERLNSELELAVDSKDKFFSIIAHDLINPISGLYTALKIFKTQKDDLTGKEQEEYLATLVKSSANANNLLTNLLEWARIQKGLIEFKPTFHNVNSIINSNIQLMQNLASSKGISVSFDANENAELECDDYMLNSLFGNLISNAIKFTKKDGTIKITSTKENDWIKVTVEDNGIGMTPEQLDSLFKIGKHFNQTGTNNEKGTGLGLILCKEFIDLHSGKISVESNHGEGSTFVVSLPEKQSKN